MAAGQLEASELGILVCKRLLKNPNNHMFLMYLL